MDFYCLLKTCYKEGISPFALYSQMCDLCKGDLKLKGKTQTLYAVYRQRDIFQEIASFKEEGEADAYIKGYALDEQRCLWEVARLLHSTWNSSAPAQSERVQKVKAPPRQNPKQKGAENGFQRIPAPLLMPMQAPAPPPAPAKKKAQQAVKKETLHISNLLSDLTVQTSASVTDFQIQTLQNGVWTTRNKGIGKHSTSVYINLDGVVADKIQLLLPQKKYSVLFLDKAHGDLTVEDKADSFERVSITQDSGKLCCECSARKVYIGGRATDIALHYTAYRFSEVEIRNTLGDVRIDLHNVGATMQEKVFAPNGNVNNARTSTNGCTVMLKAVTTYGDINIT